MVIKETLLNFADGLKVFFLPCEENGGRARIFAGRFLPIFFFAAVLLKFVFAFFLYSFPNNEFYADITKTSLVELANRERLASNLPPLAQNPLLDSAAHMKAMDMVKNGYFNHESPAGTKPWYWIDRSGYNYKYAGENLAIGFVESNEVNEAWMASPTHRENIVNAKYRDIGIAVLKANFQGNPVTLVVQMFGSRQGKTAAVTEAAPNTDFGTGGGKAKTAQADIEGEVLGAATAADNQSAMFSLMAFLAQKYFGLVQTFIYGAIALVALLLILNFAIKADAAHADLLTKALGFIVLMAVFAMIDQALVVALVPHELSVF